MTQPQKYDPALLPHTRHRVRVADQKEPLDKLDLIPLMVLALVFGFVLVVTGGGLS